MMTTFPNDGSLDRTSLSYLILRENNSIAERWAFSEVK